MVKHLSRRDARVRRREPQGPAGRFPCEPSWSGFAQRCGRPRSMADSSSRNPESSRLHATAATGAAGRSGKPHCFSFRSQRGALRFTGSCPQSTSESRCGWPLRSTARTMRSVLCAVGQCVTAAVRLRAFRSSLTSTLLPPLLDTVHENVVTPERCTPLRKDSAAALRNWLEERRGEPGSPVFPINAAAFSATTGSPTCWPSIWPSPGKHAPR